MTDNITDIQAHAQQVAQGASKQGKFNFLDRLAGRNYPTEDLIVFLDEGAAHKHQALSKELAETTEEAEVARLEADLAKVEEALRESAYTIHMRGISVEAYDKIVEAAQEAYPVEYRESVHPLSFTKEREVVESEERERHFRTHLWAAMIESVEASDGSIDDDITPEWVGAFLNHAPIIAQYRVSVVVESLRMTTDWMDAIQTDDFFRKS